MQGNDSFTYHVNNNKVMQNRSAEVSLITLERSQKLDLLIHLISNLRQSLVLCGPNGIGKTTLLDELKAQKKDDWPINIIQGTANLSFESIQGQLLRFLIQTYGEYKNQELSSILTLLDKQNQKIVVIIDDAGLLVPGLITTLIQYAEESVSLRLVFALTHDELHIKNSSDRVIDACHFIEIPPLTEKQCGVFLQNLSAQPGAVVAFNAINDCLVEKLYRETHGIPGKIVSELPKLSNYRAVSSYKKGGSILFIVAMVAVGIGYIISDKPDLKVDKELIDTPLLLQKAENVEISSPVVNSVTKGDKTDDPIELPVESVIVPVPQLTNIEDNNIVVVEDVVEKIALIQDIPNQQKLEEIDNIQVTEIDSENIEIVKEDKVEVNERTLVTEKPIERIQKVEKTNEVLSKPVDKVNEEKVKPRKSVVVENDDRLWVLKQTAKKYTIQLMVLSKRESVIEFLEKNKSLKENLKFFQISKQGQEKYVLIYGSFNNATIASEKMKSLPVKFRKSWVRRFRDLQKTINN